MIFKCTKYPNLTVLLDCGTVKFSNGEYRTDNAKEIKELKTVKEVIFTPERNKNTESVDNG